jgi:hypothetical protein
MAVAQKYLKQVKGDIEDLQAQEQRLSQELKVALEKGAPRSLESDEIDALIADSVKAIYNGYIQIAKDVACGAGDFKIRREKGVKARSFDRCKADFTERAVSLFSSGQVRTTGDAVMSRCLDLLGTAANDKRSYCDDLCVSFSQTAQAQSEKFAGVYAGPSAEALQKQLQDVKDNLMTALIEQDECQRASVALSAFAAELGAINKDIEKKMDLRMDAQDKLELAEEELEGLIEEGEALEEAANAAKAALDQITKGNKELQDLRSNTWTAEKDARDKAQAVLSEFEKAEEELAKADVANTAVLEIKALVIQTMALMWNFYEASVVNPIEGLNLATEYFDATSIDLSEKEAVMDTLHLMDIYCENTASPVFE